MDKEIKYYRKKPVVVQAYITDKHMDIPTLEGVHHANPGDYIITGVKGEQYPCKPDIFLMTYEPCEVNEGDKNEKLQKKADSESLPAN